MPKHYALGKNMQHKTVEFKNTKVVKITFDTAFSKKPMIQITPNDSAIIPAYKTQITTTSAKIRFKQKWTGEVDVLILER